MQDLVRSKKFMAASILDSIGTFIIALGFIYIKNIKIPFLPVVTWQKELGWLLVVIGVVLFVPMLVLLVSYSKQHKRRQRSPSSGQDEERFVVLNGERVSLSDRKNI